MKRKRISSASFTTDEIELMYDVIKHAKAAVIYRSDFNRFQNILSKLQSLTSCESIFAEKEKTLSEQQKRTPITPIKLNPH